MVNETHTYTKLQKKLLTIGVIIKKLRKVLARNHFRIYKRYLQELWMRIHFKPEDVQAFVENQRTPEADRRTQNLIDALETYVTARKRTKSVCVANF